MLGSFSSTSRTAEGLRLDQIRHGKHWRRWGPYLSERQWGTVREDYSATATLGNISRTTMRAAARIAGAKTGLAGLATISSCCVWAWRCGTAAIRS